MAVLKGGDKLEAFLREMSQKVTNASTLRVGWADGTTYPDGTLVGLIAAINEFGHTSVHPDQPPRPFMRLTIQDNSPHWPEQLGKLLEMTSYDANAALTMMGPEIVGQVQDSIDALTSPPLAERTIAKKGFDKPLISSGLMRKSVTFEVE